MTIPEILAMTPEELTAEVASMTLTAVRATLIQMLDPINVQNTPEYNERLLIVEAGYADRIRNDLYLQGPTGREGQPGAGITVRDEWVIATNYFYNDMVIHNNITYIAKFNHTSNVADEPGVGVNSDTTWHVMTVPVSTIEAGWNFLTSTTMSDPGSGKFKTDQVTFASSTQIAMSKTTSANVDRTNLLKTIRADDVIAIQDQANSANWVRYRVTGAITNNTSWFLIPIAMIEGGGTAPNNNSGCLFTFTQVGGGGSGGGGGGSPTGAAGGDLTGTYPNPTIASGVVTLAKLDPALIDTDVTLATNSDSKIATQKAVKTYVDAAVTGLLEFKGSTNCSSNPNYPAALKGDSYVVSVAGRIGGASGKLVDVGDVYFATADNAGGVEASVGASWTVLEHNLQGALLSTNNLSDVASTATARSNLGVPSGSGSSTGTNTGDQVITLTGNVTGSGTGSFVTAIGAGVVTLPMWASGILDTDGTLAANSDTKVPSQKAVKTYVDNFAPAASALTGTKVRAYMAINLSLFLVSSGQPWNLIRFDTETEDVLNEFNPATYTFTPVVTGVYLITFLCTIGGSGNRKVASIFQGTTEIVRISDGTVILAGGTVLASLTGGLSYTFRINPVDMANPATGLTALGGQASTSLVIRRFY